MKGMILAAGLGTRLRPLTDEISKPMVPVVNKPVTEHLIELLQTHNVNELFVNLHHYADTIRGYFADGSRWKVNLWYSHEEELMGTAGGVKKVEAFFEDNTFIVVCGDILTDIDLSELITFHKDKKALATIALTEVEDPSKYGVVVTDETGKIQDFQEKPSKQEALSNVVSCGIYVFEPQVFDYIPQDKFYDFGQDLFPLLLEKNEKVYGFLHSDYWLDIGNLNAYIKGNFDALMGRVKVKPLGEQVKSGIWVGQDTEIHRTAEVVAPLCIGDHCVIRRNAHIIGPAVIGHHNFIDEGAILQESIKLPNGHVGKNSAIIGEVMGDVPLGSAYPLDEVQGGPNSEIVGSL